MENPTERPQASPSAVDRPGKDGATRIDEQLQKLARAETIARGAGALFVAEGVPPKYVPLDEIQPPRFREVFAKTWAEEKGKSAFTVLLDAGNFHVVKVALHPRETSDGPAEA